MPEGPVWKRHGRHIVLLDGVDGPWLRQKLGKVALIEARPASELLSWQQHNRCHFVSFVINTFGAKTEKQCFNISRAILYSVFHILVANLMTASLS